MDHAETYTALETFLREQIIRGEDVELKPDTPLLEWGILTSLTTMELVAFIQRDFGLDIPVDRMSGDNFMNLDRITQLVTDLAGEKALKGAGDHRG
jgi:acyl carrier protein